MFTVELDTTVEEQLRTTASANGLTVEEYAKRLLEEAMASSRTAGQRIIDELRQEGVFDIWKDRADSRDAQAFAQTLRREAWTRHSEKP